MDNIKEYCREVYNKTYQEKFAKSRGASAKNVEKAEHEAQKEAIKTSIIEGMRHFPDVSAEKIWNDIYEIHVHQKSGVDNAQTIKDVISADQSWKKSSGHAFEEMVKSLANNALKGTKIEILLQRDLNTMLKADELNNEPRDKSWLREQVKGNVFDLYAIMRLKKEIFCFGCMQCKTSIRDRVTRDREPSIHAMQSFFWSIAIVLDGRFLQMPKFIAMVNGGTNEFRENGWHGMYVFTDEKDSGRIYHVDLDMKILKDHAIQASKQWLQQRQWFNNDWKAD